MSRFVVWSPIPIFWSQCCFLFVSRFLPVSFLKGFNLVRIDIVLTVINELPCHPVQAPTYPQSGDSYLRGKGPTVPAFSLAMAQVGGSKLVSGMSQVFTYILLVGIAGKHS